MFPLVNTRERDDESCCYKGSSPNFVSNMKQI